MTDLIEARRKAAFAACPETGCDWGSFLRGYNAALDSVAVELPKIEFDDDMNKGEWSAILSARHDCAEAIHAAGIKTKVKA